jgi:hypothetical protein
METIRVALKTPVPNARAFSVERLDENQPLPPGAIEALLVLAQNFDDPAEREADTLANAQFVGRK